MIKLFKIFFITFLFASAPRGLPALDVIGLWRHSKIAGENSLFVDVAVSPLMFDNFEFNFLPLEIRADYLPPFPLPFSIGAFMKTPNPNLKSFGLRLAYHVDLYDSFSDLYFIYCFDLGFLRNGIMTEYNDTPADLYFYDFRAGIRFFFGSWFGINVETGFKFESVVFALSIKIN